MSHPSTELKEVTIKENYYVTQKWYALTIKPSDTHQFFLREDRLNLFRTLIQQQLLHCAFKYELYYELSEPRGSINGNGSRLHLHGRIMFTDDTALLNWLLYDMSRLLKIGHIDVDTIDNEEVWIEYCNKQKLIPDAKITGCPKRQKPVKVRKHANNVVMLDNLSQLLNL